MNGEGWGIADAAALVAAVDVELAERSAADRELVNKGRLDPREADYRAKVVGDIRADLLAAFGPIGADEPPMPFSPRADRAIDWANKVRWIEAELDDRRQRYPQLVSKGRLTQADADRRLGALELLRKLYWNKMFMWEPPEGPALEYRRALRAAVLSGAPASVRDALWQSDGARIYRQLVRSHVDRLELEEHGQGRLVA